jgi:hypothetical protein
MPQDQFRVFLSAVTSEFGKERDALAADLRSCRAVLKQKWPQKRELKPIALPYLSLGNLFMGRDAFLTDLHKSLNRAGGRTAIVGSALYGLGGIGKTRAAVEYAWAHQEDYSALLFVIAETPEALRRNLAALAGPLILNLPEQSTTEEPVRLRAVLDWLGEHPRWFLILDNVDAAHTNWRLFIMVMASGRLEHQKMNSLGAHRHAPASRGLHPQHGIARRRFNYGCVT